LEVLTTIGAFGFFLLACTVVPAAEAAAVQAIIGTRVRFLAVLTIAATTHKTTTLVANLSAAASK